MIGQSDVIDRFESPPRSAEASRWCCRNGYRRVHVLLRREGWAVNHKKTLGLPRFCGQVEGLLTMRRWRPLCSTPARS